MDNISKGITEFFRKQKSREYKKGQLILRADDTPNGVYFIEKGYVKVYSLTENGTEKDKNYYKPGEIFPLIWTFSNIKKNVYFEAVDDVVVKRLPRQEFLDFIKTDKKILLDIINRITLILNVYSDRIDTLGYTKTYTRLISLLLSLSKRYGKKYGKNIVLEVPLGHREIANSIAMTRETASRELETLTKKGIISQKGHLIVIKDIKKLKKELELALGLLFLGVSF